MCALNLHVDRRFGQSICSAESRATELTRGMTMRNWYTGAIAGVAGVLFLGALAAAQNTQNNAPKSPWRYYPMERAIGDGGPAPKRDLSGTWAGPASGSGAPRQKPEVPASLTPLGKQLFDRAKPIGKF